jgi:pimeloyl-ACP methyl ester carboxylesterase
VSTAIETPVIFPSNGYDLFGILTLPETQALSERVGVLLLAGGIIPRSHRNRMWVKAARRLGAMGFHVLRFDYRGIGDSSGSLFEMRLDRPFTEDVLAAATFLRDIAKIDRLVLAGTCFGALTVLSAVEAAAPVDGLVLGAIPIFERERRRFKPQAERRLRKALRKIGEQRVIRAILTGERLDAVWRLVTRLAGACTKLLETIVSAFSRLIRGGRGAGQPAVPSGRVSDQFAKPLVTALRRKVPVLFIYGDEDFAYQEFCASIDELVLRAGLPLSEPGYELRVLKGEVHRFLDVGIQEAVVDKLVDWVACRFPARAGSSCAR